MNISAEPEAYFRIAPEDWLRAEMQGEIVALVHSHPGGLPWLSEADRRQQKQSKDYLDKTKANAQTSGANNITNPPPADPDPKDAEANAFLAAIRKANGVK